MLLLVNLLLLSFPSVRVTISPKGGSVRGNFALVEEMGGFYNDSESDIFEYCKQLQNWYDPEFIPERTTLGGHATSVITCLAVEGEYTLLQAQLTM